MFATEDKIWIVAEIVRLPADFNGKVSQGLVKEGSIESMIHFVLTVPFFSIIAYSN